MGEVLESNKSFPLQLGALDREGPSFLLASSLSSNLYLAERPFLRQAE